MNAPNPWSMPDGRLLLPTDAPREQWLQERRKGIGGSDVPLLMGVSEYSSEYELWMDKTGRKEHEPQNEAMRRGNWLEGHVVDYFAEQTKLAVRRCGLVAHRDNPILRVTPDRLTEDGGCLEVKTVGARAAKVWAEWRDGIARHAYVQGQYQLLITGRKHCWFCAYAIDSEPMIRGPVERDETLIARMRDRAVAWWETHVVGDDPPPVDLARITDEEIALRWPTAEPGTTRSAEWPAHLRALLAEREQVHKLATDAEDRKKEIDQALKVMVGDAEALLVGDQPVLTLKSQPNNPVVDPRLKTDHPDIWAAYIKRGEHRRIRILKGWDQA